MKRRMQLEKGEFQGVDLICTRNRSDTVKYLIHQLYIFQRSFDPRRPPTKTREQLKLHIDKQMKSTTFLEYLRLRKIPGIGDAKAMKVIMAVFFSSLTHRGIILSQGIRTHLEITLLHNIHGTLDKGDNGP